MAKKRRKWRRQACAAAALAALLCGRPAAAAVDFDFEAVRQEVSGSVNAVGKQLASVLGSASAAYEAVGNMTAAEVGGSCCASFDIAGEPTLISFFGQNSNNLIALAQAVASGVANEQTLILNVTQESKGVVAMFKGMIDNVTETLKYLFKHMDAKINGRQFNPQKKHAECEDIAAGFANQMESRNRQKFMTAAFQASNNFKSGLEKNFDDASAARYLLVNKQYDGKLPDGSFLPVSGVADADAQTKGILHALVISDPMPLREPMKGNTPNARKAQTQAYLHDMMTGSVRLLALQNAADYAPIPYNAKATASYERDAGFEGTAFAAEAANGINGTGTSAEQLAMIRSNAMTGVVNQQRIEEDEASDNNRKILEGSKALLFEEYKALLKEVSEVQVLAVAAAQKADQFNKLIWRHQYMQ